MQNAGMPAYVIVTLFVPFFMLVWIFISAMLAELSGWRLLLRRFAADGRQVDAGEKFSFVSAYIYRFSWLKCSYQSCLTLQVNTEGVSLRVFPLLRFRSPALFIPWESFEDLEINSGGRFMGRRTTIIIFDSPVRLTIYGQAGDAVARAFQQFREQASF